MKKVILLITICMASLSLKAGLPEFRTALAHGTKLNILFTCTQTDEDGNLMKKGFVNVSFCPYADALSGTEHGFHVHGNSEYDFYSPKMHSEKVETEKDVYLFYTLNEEQTKYSGYIGFRLHKEQSTLVCGKFNPTKESLAFIPVYMEVIGPTGDRIIEKTTVVKNENGAALLKQVINVLASHYAPSK